MMEIDERTLPLAIQKDIEALKAWHRGEKEKGLGGVLYTELYGSINGSQWGNEISKETADYLRAKYLGYKNGVDVEFYFDKNSIYDYNGNRKKKPTPSFEKVRERLKQNLAKPENKAVFERLKNK